MSVDATVLHTGASGENVASAAVQGAVTRCVGLAESGGVSPGPSDTERNEIAPMGTPVDSNVFPRPMKKQSYTV